MVNILEENAFHLISMPLEGKILFQDYNSIKYNTLLVLLEVDLGRVKKITQRAQTSATACIVYTRTLSLFSKARWLNNQYMQKSGSLIFCLSHLLIYFHEDPTSCICLILLTNKQMEALNSSLVLVTNATGCWNILYHLFHSEII